MQVLQIFEPSNSKPQNETFKKSHPNGDKERRVLNVVNQSDSRFMRPEGRSVEHSVDQADISL
jgi:hypothetical protein